MSAVLRRSTFSLKLGLLREPGIAVADVPQLAAQANGWKEPERAQCIVPVSNVDAVSLRALLYARSLGLDEKEALFFSFEEGDAASLERSWAHFPTGVPLEVVDAPYRDLGKPLLARVRQVTVDPDAVAVVVMPELVVRGTDRLLHNQRALYLKRLLLFEPRVILTSVPFQLT
jgi:hypothetical protein